jgi:DNA polymerase
MRHRSGTTEAIQAALRQHLRTLRLLGADLLPRGADEALLAIADAPAPEGASVEADEPACSSQTSEAESGEALFVASEAKRPAASGRSRADKQAALDELREAHDSECPHCTQVTGHTQTVFGEGNPDADLMFVGEAPGQEEDRQGRPFVGRSGQKLTEMIEALKLKREDVYIANVLKARPPNNATPTQAEAEKCGPYLRRQIEIIEPKVIVTLGGPAAKLLLETREGVTRIRGVWHTYRGIPVMPTFHPAYLLRQYTRENRQKVWSDLQAAMRKIS